VKTNRATGFALVVSLGCFGGLAFMPACSGNQADVDYGADGAVLTPDASVGTGDTGSTGNPGTPDAPISTTGDTGTPPSGDTGVPTGGDTGTPVTPDSGTPTGDSGSCPPATCAADSDCGCLTASGSIGCCDTVTTACFQSASSTCPDQTATGGGDSGGGGY